MGVIERLFNFIANGVMRMLWGLQEWLLKDALKITPPTERANIVAGYYYNLELFPILFAVTVVIGVISLPFARQRVTMDLFVLKMLKVLLFVTLIGAILTVAIEINNAIIDFMWPSGEYQDLQVRLNGTLEGMTGSLVLLIAVAILGKISFLTYAVFFMTLFLREFLVNALFILSPIIGAFLFLDFGPFKASSRMPKILIRATAYMLMAGIVAAGFAQVGIAIGGGFNEDAVTNSTSISDINVDTIEDLEVESQLAQMDSNGGFRALDPTVIKNTQRNFSSTSAIFETNAQSFGRGSPTNYQEQGVYEQDPVDEINDPGRLHRAKVTCATGLNGGVGGSDVGLTDLGSGLSMAGQQLAAISQGGQSGGYLQYVAEWQENIENDPDEEFTVDSVAHCMRYLIDQGIGDWSDHGGVERVSPIGTRRAIEVCADGETNTADTSEFITNHHECIAELEQKRTADLEEWRGTPEKPGPVFFWSESLSSEHRNVAKKAWDWAAVGTVDTVTLGASSHINQMFNNPNQRKVMNSFEMVGEDGSKLDGECTVGQNDVRCAQEAEFSDGFQMFMMWFMSFISPIIIMFYSGYAAIGPGMMMMSKGVKGGGGGSGGSAASNGRSSSGSNSGGSGDVLGGGTKDGLGGSDPIGTEPQSDHINADTTDQAVGGGIGPGGDPDVDADPVQSDGLGFGDVIQGAAGRANAAQKEVRNQGLGASPVSWAKSGAGHLKDNPPGSPPNAGPDRGDMSNDEILDQYDDYQEELEDVSAEDVQHAETEEGVAINPEEDELTFHEADNNDEIDGQAGTLVGEDEDGNKKRYAYHSPEGNGEALEDGESYDMDGLVTRDGDVEIDHSDNPTQDSWEGEFNTVSPGRQSDIKQIDSSSESATTTDQSGGDADAQDTMGDDEDRVDADADARDNDGLYGVDDADVNEDWEGRDVEYETIESEMPAKKDVPEEGRPARSIDPELAQDDTVDDDLKQNLQDIKSAKRNPERHLQNSGPDEGRAKQFKDQIQNGSADNDSSQSETSVKQETETTNATNQEVKKNTNVENQQSHDNQTKTEIDQADSESETNQTLNANGGGQNSEVNRANARDSTKQVDNTTEQVNQGNRDVDQINQGDSSSDPSDTTEVSSSSDSSEDAQVSSGRQDAGGRPEEANSPTEANDELDAGGNNREVNAGDNMNSASADPDTINNETRASQETPDATSQDDNSDGAGQDVPPWLDDPQEANTPSQPDDDRVDPADMGPEVQQSRPDDGGDSRIDNGSTANSHTADVQDETAKKMGNEDINETVGDDSRIDPDD